MTGSPEQAVAPGCVVAALGVSVDIDDVRIVTDATLRAEPGSVVGLIGPNGSGKSTLLRTVYRALRPVAGAVLVGGDDVWRLDARTSALRTAVVHQDDRPDLDATVRETVELGRLPHRRFLRREPDRHRLAVESALASTGLRDLVDRSVGTLSGGERQRTYVARALAQEAPLLVLDEPINHLDVLAQVELLELLAQLPATVVVALHDLNHAAAYCDQVVVMRRGRVVTHGPPADVLTAALVEDVYGVRTAVGTNPLTGRPVLYLGTAVRRRGSGPVSDGSTPTQQGAPS